MILDMLTEFVTTINDNRQEVEAWRTEVFPSIEKAVDMYFDGREDDGGELYGLMSDLSRIAYIVMKG